MRFNNLWCYRHIIFSKRFLRTLWHSRQNVLADDRGDSPQAGPYMAEFDITYRCNCRCRMCQRWNDARRESLTVGDYRRLAQEFERLGCPSTSIKTLPGNLLELVRAWITTPYCDKLAIFSP